LFRFHFDALPTLRPGVSLNICAFNISRRMVCWAKMCFRSFEQNFGHHSLVFVIQEMTMEDRHSPYHRVREIHYHVNGAAVGNIDRVQP
jgi:hypothetical protein